MKQGKIYKLILLIVILPISFALSQQRNYNPLPMDMNVGHFDMSMNPLMGDGGLQSQFSWDLTGSDPAATEIFYWPYGLVSIKYAVSNF